jgi:hypothetical protein
MKWPCCPAVILHRPYKAANGCLADAGWFMRGAAICFAHRALPGNDGFYGLTGCLTLIFPCVSYLKLCVLMPVLC